MRKNYMIKTTYADADGEMREETAYAENQANAYFLAGRIYQREADYVTDFKIEILDLKIKGRVLAVIEGE